MPSTTAAVQNPTTCLNCGAAVSGRYCGQCGQKSRPLNPTMGDVAREAAGEILDLDGKLLRSIRLLFTRPGSLTAELFAGRRASYVPPLRLYLIFSVAFFAASSIWTANPVLTDADRVELREGLSLGRGTGVRVTGEFPNGMSGEQAEARVRHAMLGWVPRAMFVLVPVCALLVMAVTRRAGRNFPQHLYFALHLHAAYFGVAALTALPELLDHAVLNGVMSLLRLLFLAVYVTMAFRTVYGGRWRLAAARGAFVVFAYTTIVGMVVLGLAFGAVLI